jgi:hypothetical protein
MLSHSRARPDAAPGSAGQRNDARRRPPRSATRGEVRNRILGAATDEAVDAMALWGFVWVRDLCGCDGNGNAWIKDATLAAGGRFKKCICGGQGRVWYPQGHKTPARLTDRQLVELYAKERARRARG